MIPAAKRHEKSEKSEGREKVPRFEVTRSPPIKTQSVIPDGKMSEKTILVVPLIREKSDKEIDNQSFVARESIEG